MEHGVVNCLRAWAQLGLARRMVCRTTNSPSTNSSLSMPYQVLVLGLWYLQVWVPLVQRGLQVLDRPVLRHSAQAHGTQQRPHVQLHHDAGCVADELAARAGWGSIGMNNAMVKTKGNTANSFASHKFTTKATACSQQNFVLMAVAHEPSWPVSWP